MSCSAQLERNLSQRQCCCHGFTFLHYACKYHPNVPLFFQEQDLTIDPMALTLKCHKGFTPIDLLMFRCDDDAPGDAEKIELIVRMLSVFPGREIQLQQSSLLGQTFGSTLTHSLVSAPYLQSLHMSSAHMTKDGIMTLLRDLRYNTTLKEIELSWIEDIDDDVSRAFQQVWQHNATLTKVSIRSRLLSLEEKTTVQSALAIGDNTSLTQLRLDMIPGYQLRLRMSSWFDLTEHHNRVHRIDRTELDMKLALNGALQGTHLGSLDHHAIPKFTSMLHEASISLSAQYILLRSVPHVWTNL